MLKKLVMFLIFGIVLQGYVFATTTAPLENVTSMQIENDINVLGRDGTKIQGLIIRITSRGSNAPTARENALLRASWEINLLGYEYFIVLSENGTEHTHSSTGYFTTYTSPSYTIGGKTYGGYTSTQYHPGYSYTTHSVEMIILCRSKNELNELTGVPIFSVNERLSRAQQILEETLEEERKQKAPGIYFDIGAVLGMGGGKTTFDNVFNDFNSFNWRIVETKIGYGPFGNIPLYAVAESILSFDFSDDFMTLLFLGAGAIIYPTRVFQLGFSLGSLWPWGFGNGRHGYKVDVDPGFSWNVSAAFDIGERNSGVLLGLNLSGSKNNYKGYYESYSYPYGRNRVSGTMSSTYLTFLFKYAYRSKIPKQTIW